MSSQNHHHIQTLNVNAKHLYHRIKKIMILKELNYTKNQMFYIFDNATIIIAKERVIHSTNETIFLPVFDENLQRWIDEKKKFNYRQNLVDISEKMLCAKYPLSNLHNKWGRPHASMLTYESNAIHSELSSFRWKSSTRPPTLSNLKLIDEIHEKTYQHLMRIII